MKPSIRPPAHIEPYVNMLGEERAVKFLLAFGGQRIHIPQSPARWGHIAEIVGEEGAAALAQAASRLPQRTPVAKPYLAQVLFTQTKDDGSAMTKRELAGILHVSDETIRRYLLKDGASRPAPTYRDDQPDLFE